MTNRHSVTGAPKLSPLERLHLANSDPDKASIRDRRVSMGLNHLELIARARVSSATLVKAERGEQIPPASMARIVAALDAIQAEREREIAERLAR